jgi:Protein of unknown function (DUF3108)
LFRNLLFKNLIKLVLYINLFLLFPLIASSAHDQKVLDNIDSKTKIYKPSSNFKIREGNFNYSISWNGIKVANASLKVELEQDSVKVEANVVTSSVISLFYTLRYHAYTKIKVKNFDLGTTVLRQTENQKLRYSSINSFINKKTGLRQISSYSWKSNGTERKYSFTPKSYTLDPFCAAFIARSTDWKLGEDKSFEVFDGKTKFLVNFKLIKKIPNNSHLSESESLLVFLPTVFDLNKKEKHKKLYSARIYISDDIVRDVILLESKVLLGSVKAKLTEFTPEKY